ncbi:hypothetical protein KUV62_10750 [Salipiger bermudensis]|uniref:hypothetical protein n=1 Tax=Salipiger bermudensis TaxID=344736 RepID=UPI001C991DBA|nr:hypothetical protein [Salipiger bermudensis]MBY6004390.1 hypothetical protein [Salipiger bermudensis]
MPDFPIRPIAAALLLALPSCSTGQSLDMVTPFDPESMSRSARHCERHWNEIYDDPRLTELCDGSFVCGDGGCETGTVIAVVAKSREAEMQALLAQLPLERMAPCDPGDPFERQYVDPLGGEGAPFGLHGVVEKLEGREIVAYCGETLPGYEADVVVALRQMGGAEIAAIRVGIGAGALPAQLRLTAVQFAAIRDAGALPLRAPLVAALEIATGLPCETTPRQTCAVTAERGRLTARLLFPDGALTGRAGHWEEAYLELSPTNPTGDLYELSVDMPITAIRRWPGDRRKPTDGFQSLDRDPGFEAFRQGLMSAVSGALADGRIGGE